MEEFMSSSKKNKKPLTAFEKYKAIQDIGTEVETPYPIFCAFKDLRTISIMGNQISFNEDYISLEEGRSAVAYLVEQLGGAVTWKD